MNFELRLKGRGARIRLKAASKEQYAFWSRRDEADLVEYLEVGAEAFDRFRVPKSAELAGGLYGCDMKDLKLKVFSEDGSLSGLAASLPQLPMELPEISQIVSVEFWSVGSKRALIQRGDGLDIEQFQSGSETADIAVITTDHCLVCVDWVESEWVYRWNDLAATPRMSDLRYLQLNLDGAECDLTECLGDLDLIGMMVLKNGRVGELTVEPFDVVDTTARVLKAE